MSLDVADVLGPNGRVAARLPQYEVRPEQLQMAEAVADAITHKRHLLVEAGTGVGKSFAYLVPAVLAAAGKEAAPGKEGDGKKRVVVSTHTISLQEQLVLRDLPFLNAVLPVEFSAVLVKGRSNYLSKRRLKGALEKSVALFGQPEEANQLDAISRWTRNTTDGSRSDLDFRPLPQVWDEVQSEHGNCLGRRCPTYQACFYYQARRRVWNADVLVTNHALFFADLALRREGASVLPDYDVVVFDEAHTLEAVAADHLGLAVSSGQTEYLLNKLFNERGRKGLLVHHARADLMQQVNQIRFLQRDFFADVRHHQERRGGNGRVRQPLPLANPVSPALEQLGRALSQYGETLEEEEAVEITSAAERCLGLAGNLDRWMRQLDPDTVYWTEPTGQRGQHLKLVAAPIEIGPVLRAELFDRTQTVVLTSATLSTGNQGFEFVKSRLGLGGCAELRLGSPFDFRTQAKLILLDGMPDPSSANAAFEDRVPAMVARYVAQTDGRAFVLFTSYRSMQRVARELAGWLAEQDLTLFCQADGMPRSLMLDRFRNEPRAVLFGTDSFWQGVDVPGDALQNVVITKLPFSVPDHPLLEARVEAIRSRGGNPFMEYQVPEAAIKLKQGFGRLIRSRRDTGQVVILDPRIRTRPYGRVFLESLPECELVVDRV